MHCHHKRYSSESTTFTLHISTLNLSLGFLITELRHHFSLFPPEQEMTLLIPRVLALLSRARGCTK